LKLLKGFTPLWNLLPNTIVVGLLLGVLRCTEFRFFGRFDREPIASQSTELIDQLIDATNELKSNEEALLRFRNENLKVMKLENEFKSWVSDEQIKRLLDEQRSWLRRFYYKNFSEKELQKLVNIHTSKEWLKLLDLNKSRASGSRPVSEYFVKLNKEIVKYRKENKPTAVRGTF